jgi:AraC-like DNA-binding protein
MQVALLKCTLLTVIIVAVFNHTLWHRSKSEMPFNRLLGIANLYVCFHALFTMIISYFFFKSPLYDRLSPFTLMYGPFLYFAFYIILHGRISATKVFVHAIPFLLFCLDYSILLIQGMPEYPTFLYGRCLAWFAVLSFSCYMIWVMAHNSFPVAEQFKKHKLIVIVATVLLLFATMVMFAGIIYDGIADHFHTPSNLFKLLMYGCLLSSVLIINRFYNWVDRDFIEPEPIVTAEVNSESTYEGKYEKSAVPDAQLDVYLIKLEYLMEVQRVYLYQDLSLLKLAKLMRIPKHHITQVLNVKLKMNFYEYVNGLRVQHACMLLEENAIDNLENVAKKSGFNSKVSFNRHFKAIKGLTPSEYRLTVLK